MTTWLEAALVLRDTMIRVQYEYADGRRGEALYAYGEDDLGGLFSDMVWHAAMFGVESMWTGEAGDALPGDRKVIKR